MNKYIGVNTTHDAAVAVIDGGELVGSIELEKLPGNQRHADMKSLEVIPLLAKKMGASTQQSSLTIDGYFTGYIKEHSLSVANYNDGMEAGHGLYRAKESTERWLKHTKSNKPVYSSFPHIYGHIMGAYASSPWAQYREPSYSLVWDGGMLPTLHYVDPNSPLQRIKPIKTLHCITGTFYGIMGYYAGPFKDEKVANSSRIPFIHKGERHWPGKLMGYIAKGEVLEKLLEICFDVYSKLEANYDRSNSHHQITCGLEHALMRGIMLRAFHYCDEDILATVHKFLEVLTISRLAEIGKGSKLAFSGGSALNIKWNKAIRDTGHFSEIWIPPFCNDSGSAIGQAACERAFVEDEWSLEWSVYSGPEFIEDDPIKGWYADPTTTTEVAAYLHENPSSPILSLQGKAELGPRALGNRSILANPTCGRVKDILNTIKGREDWRPVAPIALEEDGREYFKSGYDPYMLYETGIRNGGDIPAVVHIDNTSRVQTVNTSQNKPVADLLASFKNLSGVGVLCNTSANENGCGFFSRLSEASRWASKNGVVKIWTGEFLYTYDSNQS